MEEVDRTYIDNVKKFDDMVEKGIDSDIAVIYIDGNNMGVKVQESLKDAVTYEECLAQLRSFSKNIQSAYVEDGVRHVIDSLSGRKYRVVVAAGDEINFVVRASDALAAVCAYLRGLYKEGKEDSACAGIVVFNSHAPYADAYSLAEECCENAKKIMKEKKLHTACLLDFHLVQGAMGTSLEEIRKHEGTEETSRPWLICGETAAYDPQKGITDLRDIGALVCLFKKLGRSNVKGLAGIAMQDASGLEMELRRIKAHLNIREEKEKEEVKDALDMWIGKLRSDQPEEQIRRTRMMIYDAVLCFDKWAASFEKEKKEAAD